MQNFFTRSACRFLQAVLGSASRKDLAQPPDSESWATERATGRKRQGFAVAALAAAVVFAGVVPGCQRQPRSSQAAPQVSVTPMMGGMGGFLIQIVPADSDLVSIYHAPIQAFDREQGMGDEVSFQLLFQFHASDAGAGGLPVRRPPSPSAVAVR